MAKGTGLSGMFMKRFSTKGKCQEYLAAQRWKSGYVCPKCGRRQGYRRLMGGINAPNAVTRHR